MFKPWGVYDESCFVEVLQSNTNLLIGGEHTGADPESGKRGGHLAEKS